MFGPAILVNPVTDPATQSRRLYLPQAKWFDFWMGTATEGARSVDAPAPLDRIPLFIRAGSILPMGPEEEWSTQKTPDPIELRIYRGADGDFTLYEDENDNYNYEKGAYATIPFHWDEAAQTLTIGDRKGHFPGMLRGSKLPRGVCPRESRSRRGRNRRTRQGRAVFGKRDHGQAVRHGVSRTLIWEAPIQSFTVVPVLAAS